MYRLTQVLRLAIVRARPQKNPVPPKGYLGLGSYMGRDFDGQIADATLCYITYIVM